ncbi:nitrile hydratase subunit beta [Primorskyibacter sp. S87]|uniref:nitrile hydratase subunit beta n=1 Tax=Primorskyibacter sp. S87 TaxID=3415126 RepID=UPI003C7AEFD8
MTRVHDMGGRYGDGSVQPEREDGAVFTDDWHGRALALTLACGALGKWNIDISRHARERLSPKDYSRFSYYEKWIAGLADLLVETDLLSEADLKTPDDIEACPPADQRLEAGDVASVLARGAPADRQTNIAPGFEVGQRVRTISRAGNRMVDGGHTRLPAYAQGATGQILRMHGTHVFPDSSAHRLGEAPEPLYAVVFPASELWVYPENPADEVVLDLWQSYLVKA